MLNLNCTSDNNEKKNKALKLHHQFVHHNYKKIVDLLKDPEVNDKELEEELKKVLVKHSSSYVRVHPCQLQLINNMKENELERTESKLKEQ